MRTALLLAALLTTACASTAKLPTVMPLQSATEKASASLTLELPTPPGATWVYDVDPGCAHEPIGYTLPKPEVAKCWSEAAREYLKTQVQSKQLLPGDRFECFKYLPREREACIGLVFSRVPPEVRYGLSARYLTGSIGGKPWTGCAAGVAYAGFAYVYLGEPSRVPSLVSWETSNWYLAYLLDLYKQADGPHAAAATDYARRVCPAY